MTEIFHLVPELKGYYDLYQLLLFHLQEKNADYFVDLIEEALPHLNQTFKKMCIRDRFEAVGLSDSVVNKYFTGTVTRIGGLSLDQIEKEYDD